MSVFVYKAITKDGIEKKGSIDANNQDAAAAILKNSGNYLLEINEQGALQKDLKISFGSLVKTKDLAVFCRQFYSILSAGVTVLVALELLEEQTENKEFRKVLKDLGNRVEKGETLTIAMSHHNKIFPSILVNMIDAGEASGNLDVCLERMAKHFEKELKLNQTVKKAITYPIIVSVISVVVVTILVTVVVPTFVGIFDTIGMELPLTTRLVLSISSFFRTKWYIVIIIISGFIGFISYYRKQEEGKKNIAAMMLKLPLFGKLNTKIYSSRFARTLSTLLASGIPLLTALDIVSKVVSNYVVEKHVIEAKEQVSRGVPLSSILRQGGVFPTLISQITKIGEDTGTLEEMLNKIADYYDDEVEISVSQLTTMLEPLIIVILAIVVGFVVISIVQPMFQMYNGISNY